MQSFVKSCCVWGIFVLVSTSVFAATYYVDDDGPNDPGPYDPNVSDPLMDRSRGLFDAENGLLCRKQRFFQLSPITSLLL